MRKSQDNPSKLALTLLISLVILGFLGLQLYTAQHLRVFWPKFRLQYAHKLLKPPKVPALWPFIDYPMYNYPKYEGDKLNQYFIFGILEDSTEVLIRPEDLGLNYWIFMYGFKESLRKGNDKDIKNFAKLYESRHNKKLLGLRFEDRPLVLSKERVVPGSPEVVKNIKLEDLEKKE